MRQTIRFARPYVAADTLAELRGPTLRRLWHRLTLPPDVRDLWETRIPALTRRSAA